MFKRLAALVILAVVITPPVYASNFFVSVPRPFLSALRVWGPRLNQDVQGKTDEYDGVRLFVTDAVEWGVMVPFYKFRAFRVFAAPYGVSQVVWEQKISYIYLNRPKNDDPKIEGTGRKWSHRFGVRVGLDAKKKFLFIQAGIGLETKREYTHSAYGFWGKEKATALHFYAWIQDFSYEGSAGIIIKRIRITLLSVQGFSRIYNGNSAWDRDGGGYQVRVGIGAGVDF